MLEVSPAVPAWPQHSVPRCSTQVCRHLMWYNRPKMLPDPLDLPSWSLGEMKDGQWEQQHPQATDWSVAPEQGVFLASPACSTKEAALLQLRGDNSEAPRFGGKSCFWSSSSTVDYAAPIANGHWNKPGFGLVFSWGHVLKKGLFNLDNFRGLIFRDSKKPSAIIGARKGIVVSHWHICVPVTSRCDPSSAAEPPGTLVRPSFPPWHWNKW